MATDYTDPFAPDQNRRLYDADVGVNIFVLQWTSRTGRAFTIARRRQVADEGRRVGATVSGALT